MGHSFAWIYERVGNTVEKAYVITLKGHEYSEASAKRCIESAAQFGIEVQKYPAIDQTKAEQYMINHGLKWTWAKNNTAIDHCPLTGLRQHPYGKLAAKIGCSMSHFLLWQKCFFNNETLLILEHDAVFLRPLPDIDFHGICMINDPRGATPHSEMWADRMIKRGPGVFRKTKIMQFMQPDGLAGNSAYLIKPWAAELLILAFRNYGVWPNDATMCIQLLPFLQELYPFVTRVEQTQSTTT